LVLIKTAQICEPFSTEWLKDKPDLQIGNFGIEVTEAIDKKTESYVKSIQRF